MTEYTIRIFKEYIIDTMSPEAAIDDGYEELRQIDALEKGFEVKIIGIN